MSTSDDAIKFSQRALRLFISFSGVGMLTYLAFAVLPVNATSIGLAYLLYVLIVATTWGFLEASLSSIAATLAFNFFFLPPIGTLTISDPQNWIALFAFLVTSLIASRQSTKAKQRALDAEERQRDLERLYTFSRAILLIEGGEPFAKQLAKKLADTFELSAAALYERRTGEIFRAGPIDFEGIDSQLREAALQGTAFADPERKRVITGVRLGSEPIAGLAIQGVRMSDSVLQSIANLVAIGLERARAQELTHEIEAAQRSEQLRKTLIDAMAHELKTPLTAIRAATTALVANPDRPLANMARMVRIADEEAAHLVELIDNALDTANLDSDRIDVDWELSSLNEAIHEVISALKSKIGDQVIEFGYDDQWPLICFDRRLIKLAVKQVLDNAIKYSPSEKPIRVRASRVNGTMVIEITDHGRGISPQEQARIFDRFYRSPLVRDQIPGLGLGLSIAHRIMQAHGGDLTVRSHPGETTFSLMLPIRDRGDEN